MKGIENCPWCGFDLVYNRFDEGQTDEWHCLKCGTMVVVPDEAKERHQA